MSTPAASAPYGGDPPTIENRKVPLRRANVAYGSLEYLSDKEGGGADGGGGRRRSPWCARCRADPDCLPPRPARVRAGEPALGSGQPAVGATARHAAQAWHRLGPPLAPAGTARLAPAAAGLPGQRLRIRERAQDAALRRCGAQDRRSTRTRSRHRVPGPSAHAAPTPPATSWPTTGRTRGRSSII
jgi:hypothetical protein